MRASGCGGLGLANVRSRLQLHYGAEHSFSIQEVDRGKVQVSVRLPLQFSSDQVESTTRFGA
jgi:two-component system LytT family sensor kinase